MNDAESDFFYSLLEYSKPVLVREEVVCLAFKVYCVTVLIKRFHLLQLMIPGFVNSLPSVFIRDSLN